MKCFGLAALPFCIPHSHICCTGRHYCRGLSHIFECYDKTANAIWINRGQTIENNRPSKHRRARWINDTGKVLTII